jgi:hypothetical protein
MVPGEALVSLGIGKAQIKHHGKWVTLYPQAKDIADLDYAVLGE